MHCISSLSIHFVRASCTCLQSSLIKMIIHFFAPFSLLCFTAADLHNTYHTSSLCSTCFADSSSCAWDAVIVASLHPSSHLLFITTTTNNRFPVILKSRSQTPPFHVCPHPSLHTTFDHSTDLLTSEIRNCVHRQLLTAHGITSNRETSATHSRRSCLIRG